MGLTPEEQAVITRLRRVLDDRKYPAIHEVGADEYLLVLKFVVGWACDNTIHHDIDGKEVFYVAFGPHEGLMFKGTELIIV